MAAGAIPPPLFFERGRHASILAPGQWHTRGHQEDKPAPISLLKRPARSSPTTVRPVTAKDI
jgi:hypothetical protein